MTKIVLTSRCSWTLYNFRWDLIQELQRSGYTVVGGGAGGDGFEKCVEDLGVPFTRLPVDKKATNPLRDVRLLSALKKWYRKERPDVVHNFTIKPVIYGTLAAHYARVPMIINTVPGLGYAFTREAPAWVTRIVEYLYRISLVHANFTIFLNNDDRQLFIDRRMVNPARSAVLPEWVDAEHFGPDDDADDAGGESHDPNATTVFLMLARLLQEKGVYEYVAAARKLKQEGVNAKCVLIGGRDERNPRVVPESDLRAWQAEGVIEYLGEVADVRGIMRQADVVVLPSYYREGMPRALLEGAAMEKAAIATDNVGCRDVVRNGVTGLLVPVRDVDALAAAMRNLVDDPEKRRQMGRAGRELILKEFDKPIVLKKLLEIYRKGTL
jgi:glycosyltransferase involved in cell wall biosynthesis